MISNLFNKNQKNKNNDQNNDLMKVVALLIHAAKIDENYSKKERRMIVNFTELFLKKEREKKIKNTIKIFFKKIFIR